MESWIFPFYLLMLQYMMILACGNHDNFTRNLQVPHVEVNGKTLGVIGAGHIGRKVIQIAQALDMNILVYTRTPREDEKGIHYVSLEELLKNSDYISMHCPLTESTKHMINKESLSLMKPSAFIINTSRGALIDETALIEALEMVRLQEPDLMFRKLNHLKRTALFILWIKSS